MNKPLVSVVMGCYNDEKYIREAIDSILNQTINDLELLIIDDCSSDSTIEIIESYSDNRITFIKNTENKGLGFNLNLGVRIAKGKYIARMDADDISMPTRLERQVMYLEKHPQTICVGTSARKIGDISLRTKILSPIMKQYTSYHHIQVALLLGTPMLHPSVMFNRQLLLKTGLNYNPSYRRAQDYELWSRMIACQYKMENLPDILFCYRYTKTQASAKHRDDQIKRSLPIYKQLIVNFINKEVSDEDLQIHAQFATAQTITKNDIIKLRKWIFFFLKESKAKDSIDYEFMLNFFKRRWTALCRNSFPLLQRYKYYKEISQISKFRIDDFIRLFI